MTADRRSLLDALAETDAELVMDIDTTEVKRRAALVEKVARAICKEDGREPDSLDPWMGEHQHPAWEDYEDQATAAIDLIRAEVLEEAAKVAEATGTYELLPPEEGTYTVSTAREIAAAIRALKEKQ